MLHVCTEPLGTMAVHTDKKKNNTKTTARRGRSLANERQARSVARARDNLAQKHGVLGRGTGGDCGRIQMVLNRIEQR